MPPTNHSQPSEAMSTANNRKKTSPVASNKNAAISLFEGGKAASLSIQIPWFRQCRTIRHHRRMCLLRYLP